MGSRLHAAKPQWWPSSVSCIFLVLTIARRRQTPPGRSKERQGSLTTNYRNDNAGLDEIISDEIVEFNGDGDRKLDHKVRVICVRINPHTARGKYAGGSSGVDSDGILRIATNLLDVPADVIALIFAYRWAIEIFFRFFKHMLGCRHLLSHKGERRKRTYQCTPHAPP
jgi:hypothetical protein